jgi:hypothetical protein
MERVHNYNNINESLLESQDHKFYLYRHGPARPSPPNRWISSTVYSSVALWLWQSEDVRLAARSFDTMTHASAAEVFSPRGKQKMVYSKHDSINTVALGRCFTPTSRDDQILLVTSKHYQSSPDLSRFSHNQTPEYGRPRRYGSPNNGQGLGYSSHGRGLGGPGLGQSPKRTVDLSLGSADGWEEAQSRWRGQGADRLPLPAAAATTTRHSPSGQSLRSQDSGFSDSGGEGAVVVGLPTLDISSYAVQQADRSSCDRGACSSSGLIGTCDKRTAGCVTADSHNRKEREQHG